MAITPPITGNYTLVANPNQWKSLPNEQVRLECDSSGGPVNITLPKIADLKRFWNVKIFVADISDSSGINPITIISNASDKIDGASSVTINTSGGSTEIQVADENSWMALESNSSSTQVSFEVFSAFAGGGQTNATLLTADKNLVNAVFSNGDSVKLKSATSKKSYVIQNRSGGGNSCDVYPQLGESFYGLLPNAPLSIADGNDLVVNCYINGVWIF